MIGGLTTLVVWVLVAIFIVHKLTFLFGSEKDFMRIDEYPTQFGEQYDLGANNVQVFMQLKSQDNNQVTYFNYNDVTKYLKIQYVLKTIENGIVK